MKHLTIGVILDQLDSPFVTHIWHAVSAEAKRHGHNLILFQGQQLDRPYRYTKEENIIYNLVSESSVDGIILSTGTVQPFTGIGFEEFLNQYKQIPLISISISLDNIPSVIIDNKMGMAQGIRHLIEHHGYRKIAFVKGIKYNEEALNRYEAYEEVLKEFDIPINPQYIVQGDFRPQSGIRAVELFKERNSLDMEAIVCANDDMAISLIGSLNKEGLKIPNDIAVLGFDDKPGVEFLKPPMSTINQPIAIMVNKAYSVLMEIIQGKEVELIHRIPAQLVTRESCGCLPSLIQNWIVKEKSKPGEEKSLEYRVEHGLGFPLNLKDIILDIIAKLKKSIDLKNPGKEDYSNFIQTLNFYASRSILEVRDDLNWSELLSELLKESNEKLTSKDDKEVLEDVFSLAHGLITNIHKRLEVLSKYSKSNKDDFHREFKQDLNFVNTIDQCTHALKSHFERIGLDYGFLVLYDGKPNKKKMYHWDIPRESSLVFQHSLGSQRFKNLPISFSTEELLPQEYWDQEEPFQLSVTCLYHKDDQFGYLLQGLNLLDDDYYVTSQEYLSYTLSFVYLWQDRQKLEQDIQATLDELTLSNKKLTELDDMKNDLIANITHDFRSPLSIIQNNADIVKKYIDLGDKESVLKRVDSIYSASSKLKSAIDRLLDLAKMDSQGLKLKIQRTKPKQYLSQLVDFYRSSVMSSKIMILESLPLFEIEDFYTDMDKLEEILSNIISNAVKYINADQGEIIISLDDKGDTLEISIKDNGIGIKQEELERIFNRFEQVDSSRNSHYKGTGLGLAFAKQLTEYLKGTIRAESEGLNKGAEFVLEFKKGIDVFDPELIILPSEEKQRIISKNNSQVEQSLFDKDIEPLTGIKEYISGLNEPDEFDRKKGVILLIDDNAEILDIEIQYLRNNGYKNFITASDGVLGIEAAYHYRPDFILSDFNMPNMRGDEFHDNLVGNPDFKKVPLVFVTALADRGVLINRQRKGAIAILGKPIEEDELITSVDIHMQKYMEYKEVLLFATIDELTGILNRRHLLKQLSKNLAIRSLRDLTILFLDIDHFKKINDTHGHIAGDKILSALGSVINDNIRTYDLAGRYGGEEIILLLPDTDISKGKFVAEKLLDIIREIEVLHNDESIKITASFGISSLIDDQNYICKKLNINNLKELYEVVPLKDTDWAQIERKKKELCNIMIEMADMALYHAKSTLCNSCGFKSEKEKDFVDSVCSLCGSPELILGRNKIVMFSEI
ncbi:MAG: diguanylate cyclase [Spirochaetaceae bacterium]|jgi:diguanylate cyclase (GGDEF)-like protein|nr:diguanylate cyclase [Spirochaetaceae bacterium]